MANAASSSLNTASTCAPACPAAAAKPQSAASFWPVAALISARYARSKSNLYGFLKLFAFQTPINQTVQAEQASKPLKRENPLNGTQIATK
jgi:hypothetical protein